MESGSKNRLAIPPQVKTIQSRYDYPAAWAFLHDKGVELFGKNFQLYPEDAELILKLIAWFIKDEEAAKKWTIDLEKGVMLVGPVGCGKKSLMHICRFLLAADKRHIIKPCREITFEFIKEGYEMFHRYTKGSFKEQGFDPKTFCFDDLGLENENPDGTPNPLAYFIHEEEVPRSGVIVSQSFQRTRWANGEVFVWLGMKKETGKGEGSSGLGFDQLVDIK